MAKAIESGDYVFYITKTGNKSIYKVLAPKGNKFTVQQVDFNGGMGKQKFEAKPEVLRRIWLQPNDKVVCTKTGKKGVVEGYSIDMKGTGAKAVYTNNFTIVWTNFQQEWIEMSVAITRLNLEEEAVTI